MSITSKWITSKKELQLYEVTISLIIDTDDDFADLYKDAIKNKRHNLIRLEYLVPIKMVAGRLRDWCDIESLIVEKSINLKETRQIIKKHLGQYGLRRFNEFVQETLWKQSVGRA